MQTTPKLRSHISLSGNGGHIRALNAEDWLYFLRRGLEARVATSFRVGPSYNNNVTAQEWWLTGYDYATAFIQDGYSPPRTPSYDSVDTSRFRDAFFQCMQKATGQSINCHTNKKLQMWVDRLVKLYPNLFYYNPPEPEGTAEMSQLYKVIDKEIYGTKVGINSDGKIVLEIKGDYKPFDPAAIEKVMPYTVDISFGDRSGPYSYRANKSELGKGDFVAINTDNGFKIAKVVAVDTKSTRATKYVSGAKITGLIPLTVEKIDGDNSF